MQLARYRLRPRSTWISDWQSDTLMGLLAALYMREAETEETETEEAERDLLGPWRDGNPPFVLSDAFPGDFLPAPACLGLFSSVGESNKKRVRRVSWLTKEQFQEVQAGRLPQGVFSSDPKDLVQDRLRMRNSIDRGVNSTGLAGTLYEVPLHALARGIDFLSVYAQVDAGRISLLTRLFRLLMSTGFGADAGVSQGEVELVGEPEPFSLQVDEPTGWISLSTFQPAQADPVVGWWRSFVKYGRLGPVTSVFKRPQWMLRPGATFFTGTAPREWYGRWIPSSDLLPNTTITELSAEGIEPGQAAFALAVPLQWVEDFRLDAR
jgi:CRISPR-associated protein Csm4